MTPPKKHFSFPFAILKEMEIYKLFEKELNIIIKEAQQLQENIDG